MVIVDASVWIDYFAPRANVHTTWLDKELEHKSIGLTDNILYEVLQGTRSDATFSARLRELSHFSIFDSGGEELAVASAQHYRFLRSKGITIRTAVDCLIATFCINHHHSLLHRDRDFEPFEKYLGLGVVHPAIH